MTILANKKGLSGQKTNAVLLSTPFVFELLSPDFAATHADIDTAIILHKICNASGVIRYACVHHIVQQIHHYFESPRSHSQIYESMSKFEKRELIKVVRHDDGKYTYRLNHFLQENGDLHRYVAIDPIVFKKSFSDLTLAARKLFLLTAIQQGDKVVLRRSLYGDNGLYRILCKNQPNHIQAVIDELKGKNPKHQVYLTSGKLEKNRGRYEYVYLSVNRDLIPSINPGEKYREPLSYKMTYPRKVSFINRVLQELRIGELAEQMPILIQLMKRLGYRVIRQVLRKIKEHVEIYRRFPKEISTFVKKEIRFIKENEILDLAHEYGIYHFIAPGLVGGERKDRLFEFTLALSTYPSKTLKKMFKQAKDVIKNVYTKPIELTVRHYVHNTIFQDTEAIWGIRFDAYNNEVDPAFYEDLEHEAEKRYMSGKIKTISEAITWMFEQLTIYKDKHPLPKEAAYGDYGKLEYLIIHSYEN